ncbi:hypothetical protein FOZ63_010839, partial [Perkinsus olseni]
LPSTRWRVRHLSRGKLRQLHISDVLGRRWACGGGYRGTHREVKVSNSMGSLPRGRQPGHIRSE